MVSVFVYSILLLMVSQMRKVVKSSDKSIFINFQKKNTGSFKNNDGTSNVSNASRVSLFQFLLFSCSYQQFLSNDELTDSSGNFWIGRWGGLYKRLFMSFFPSCCSLLLIACALNCEDCNTAFECNTGRCTDGYYLDDTQTNVCVGEYLPWNIVLKIFFF